MNLRPYQITAIEQLREGFKNHRRQILSLPTGGGKTVVFSHIAQSAANKGKSVCILTDRIELLQQAGSTLPIRPYYLTAGASIPYRAPVIVGMVETVARRLAKGWNYTPDLLIVDEAHRGNFTKVLEHWSDTPTIGATATPVGKHLAKFYTNIIDPVQIPDLVADGYLCTYRPIQVQDDLSDLTVQRGEFTAKSLHDHYNNVKRFHGVVEHYQQHAAGSKAIVFNCDIQHSNNTRDAFRAAGYTSESVTSKTHPDERRRILAAFRDGHIQILNNCGILTTGYDEPSIETVIMNRATMSLPLWLQCCGRGARIYPGKERFTVIDLGLNHDRLGFWDDTRTWTLDADKKRKSKPSAPPTKSCPKCNALCLAAAKICVHCGHEFAAEHDQVIGVGVELQRDAPEYLKGRKLSDLTMADIIALKDAKRYTMNFVIRIARIRGQAALQELARLKGYSPKWVQYQLSRRMPGDVFNDYFIR
jgi:superfamily II DNA or RNA helicase